MRFILNFFIFGLLFYVIYLFFPDAFHTLVSWADKVYASLHDLFMGLSDHAHRAQGNPEGNPDLHRALWLPLIVLFRPLKKF